MIHYKSHFNNKFDLNSYCLENKLYESTHSNSAFLRLYNGEKSMSLLPVSGFETLIAFYEDQPIGIGIIEYLADPYEVSMKNSKISINKKISIYTYIGLYVKEKYRKKGLGKEICKRLCKNAYERKGQFLDNIPGMAATGISEIIAGKTKDNPYHFVFNCPTKCYATDTTFKSMYSKQISDIFYYKDPSNRIFSPNITDSITINFPKKAKVKKKKMKRY